MNILYPTSFPCTDLCKRVSTIGISFQFYFMESLLFLDSDKNSLFTTVRFPRRTEPCRCVQDFLKRLPLDTNRCESAKTS